jgi:hypothetical protein
VIGPRRNPELNFISAGFVPNERECFTNSITGRFVMAVASAFISLTDYCSMPSSSLYDERWMISATLRAEVASFALPSRTASDHPRISTMQMVRLKSRPHTSLLNLQFVGIIDWLDERKIIEMEWVKIKDMMESAHHLDMSVKRGEED